MARAFFASLLQKTSAAPARLGLAAGSVLTTSLYFVAFPAMYAYHPVAFVAFFGVPLFMRRSR